MKCLMCTKPVEDDQLFVPLQLMQAYPGQGKRPRATRFGIHLECLKSEPVSEILVNQLGTLIDPTGMAERRRQEHVQRSKPAHRRRRLFR